MFSLTFTVKDDTRACMEYFENKKSYEDVVFECKNLISYTAVNTEPVFPPQTNVMFRK